MKILKKRISSALVMFLLTLIVCVPFDAIAKDEGRVAENEQKQPETADFLKVLHECAERWVAGADDGGGNSETLSLNRVGHLLEDPTIGGHQAAALGAIFRHMRYKKTNEVSLDQLNDWAKELTVLYSATCKRIDCGVSLYGASDHPVIAEIQQGGLGDCYFISSVNAILSRAPQKIMEMIEHGPAPNEFLVRFPGYDSTIKIRLTPGEIASLPNSDGDNGVWLTVLVMADSAVRNGGQVPSVPYINMSGGHPGRCLHMLTGMEYTHLPLRKTSPRFIRRILGRAEEGNFPVGVNTPDHDCCVISYDRQTELVTVKNPWGTDGKYSFKNGSEVQMDKGLFQMNIEQFMTCFSGITFPKRLLGV